jgi:hypothetical protein
VSTFIECGPDSDPTIFIKTALIKIVETVSPLRQCCDIVSYRFGPVRSVTKKYDAKKREPRITRWTPYGRTNHTKMTLNIPNPENITVFLMLGVLSRIEYIKEENRNSIPAVYSASLWSVIRASTADGIRKHNVIYLGTEPQHAFPTAATPKAQIIVIITCTIVTDIATSCVQYSTGEIRPTGA